MLTWTAHTTNDATGIVNLRTALPAAMYQNNATAYAFCTLHSDVARDIKISLWTDDGGAVWVNGEEVHRNPRRGGFTPEGDVFLASVRSGQNRCLVKVTQVDNEWKFAMKAEVVDISGVLVYDTGSVVAGQQGKKPLPGVTVSLLQPGNPAPIQTTHSDVNGRFAFTGVSDPVLLVNLEKEPDLEGLPKLRLSEPSLALIEVSRRPGQSINLGEIEYEAGGGFVRGIVFLNEDGTGMPTDNPRLARVPVSLHNLVKNTSTKAETDSQGAYYFDNPEPAVYTLKFERTLDAAKHGLGEGKLTLPETLPGSFFLGPDEEKTQNLGYLLLGGTVHGVVFLDKDANKQRFGDERGIPDVPVILVDARGRVAGGDETSENGEYSIDVSPGKYTLQFNDVLVLPSGPPGGFRDLFGDEFLLTTDRTQAITVGAGETAEAKPAGYTPETHEIRGRVIFDDGTPVRKLVVTLADSNNKEIDRAVTDDDGNYVFTGREGTFTLVFPESPSDGQLLTPKTRPAHVTSIFRAPDTIYRLAAGDGGGGAVGGISTSGSVQDVVSDIASYMPTSQEVTGPTARPRGTGGIGTATAPLQQLVDSTLLDVLGRKLKTADPKAFLASLTRAFTPEEINGRTTYHWTPRTYAVQTELGGGITGAQASLYHRAKIALDDALPLLDRLEPLLASPDKQEVEAARAIVRTEFSELVSELGVEGGPRVQRVDDLFALLRRELERLERVFGLTRENVITVEEEQNLTNYLVVRDYLDGLFTTWSGERGFRNQFAGTEARFLGTQLVLMSRALSVVAESVEEVYNAMDAVNLGPAERQTVRIEFPQVIRIDNGENPLLSTAPGRIPSMTVDELLSWVSRFATREGPTLIQDGGRRGVEAIQPIAERLQRLVLGASQANVPHIGFSRVRVRRALNELAAQLGQLERLARELSPNGTGQTP
jgi:hypothetical protein